MTVPAAKEPMIWANLLHLSYNMWCDWLNPNVVNTYPYYPGRPYLRFEEPFWDELLQRMVDVGFNMVVLDLGDSVRYDSHPEIAVENAWSPAKLRDEVGKMRQMGLEPIPKLNFSTCHDHWLGPYSRMVSTPVYYEVCRDLIAETMDLFDRPRLFHLGMDEEDQKHQKHFEYVVVRQHGLWWRDLWFMVNEVEKAGSRAWIWSDYVWEHPEMFWENMTPNVLQSNWYYGIDFREDVREPSYYLELEKRGFDQVPVVSNWEKRESIGLAVDFCRKHIAPERLKGFIYTPWRPTLSETRLRHVDGIEAMGEVIRAWG